MSAPRNGGRYEEAIAMAKTGLAETEKLYGPNSHNAADANLMLGDLYYENGSEQDAESYYRQALEIYRETPAENPEKMSIVMIKMAGLCGYPESRDIYKEAISALERSYGIDSSLIPVAMDRLAKLYMNHGEYSAAEELYEDYIELAHTVHSDDDLRIVAAFQKLAGLKFDRAKYIEAGDLYRRALKVCKKTAGIDSPVTISIARELAAVYRKIGEEKKAIDIEGSVK